MQHVIRKIEDNDWANISGQMHKDGYAMIPGLLTAVQCDELRSHYNKTDAYRKTVVMERYRFGLGEYKYFNYPLPDIIEQIRTGIYPRLAPVANSWFNVLNMDRRFPLSHAELLRQCHDQGQQKATVLMLKYGEGGFNTLHQDLYGEIYFPLQMVIMLSEPGRDFTGGEFVLTQQIPRAQSKAIVLSPGKGDALIFTTNFKPVKGTKGYYYRVHVKHGVSEVRSGERYTLGVIFHDAQS